MISLVRKRSLFFSNPARVIASSFAGVIAIGTLLLTLPICSRSGQFTPFFDALFTATSATCVTGLVVYDTYSHFSEFGQVVILTLIQIGGLGLVTFTTFFNLLIGRKLGLRGMQIAQESVNADSMGNVKSLAKLIVFFSLAVEMLGAIVLATVFVPRYGRSGYFISIFTAISAYCNAGFDIMGRDEPFTSLTGFVDNPLIVFGVAALIIIGGMGFAVWMDILRFRKTKKLSLHTRLVLFMTALLIAIGFFIFLMLEWNNPATMGPLGFWGKLQAAFFQSVTTRTAGFNTISIGEMYGSTKLGAIILMFIGAAPGSTGGGIKVTTIAVIVMTVVCVLKDREDTIIMRHKVGHKAAYKAMAIFSVAVLLVSLFATVIYFSQIDLTGPLGGLDAAFEQVSAFATVGLSVGVTAAANPLTRILLIITMFLGRVGPVSLALSLAMQKGQSRKEVIPDGKILVG